MGDNYSSRGVLSSARDNEKRAVANCMKRHYHDFMTKRHDRRQSGRVAEPVQVYLDPADRERLERLAERLEATKSDVLRRALAALESQVRQPVPAPGGGAPPLPTFNGKGLQAGVDLDDSANLLDLMQQGDAPR